MDKHEGRLRITVHGRNLQNKLSIVSDVKFEIIPNTPEMHEVWVDNSVRASCHGTSCDNR